MNAIDTMVDNKELREKYIERVDVLDKVKKLLLIPQLEMMTIRQVSDFYEVEYNTIHRYCQRHKDELESDGVITMNPRNIAKIFNGTLSAFKDCRQEHGKMILKIDDNTQIVIPNIGIRMFPKRAILRVGMLLRDSKIAQEVRAQLLNVVEQASPEMLTAEINKEQQLLNAIGEAFSTGDIMKFAEATMNLNSYKDRHIKAIEAQNAKLVSENEVLQPKADYCDKVLASKDAILPTQLAKLFGMSAQRFHKICKELGIMWKVGNQWVLYSKYDGLGYTKTKTYADAYGRTFSTTCFTNAGIKFIVDKFAKIGIVPNKEK